MKKLCIAIVIAFISIGVNAQEIKGNWQMYKNVDTPSADINGAPGKTKTAEELDANKWLSFKKGEMTMKLQIQGGEIGEDTYDYEINDEVITMKRGDRSKEYGTIVSITENELVIFTKMDGWDHYKRLD
jgi:hypothetical protein